MKRHRKNGKGILQYEDKTTEKGKEVPDYKKPIYVEETVPNIEVRIGGLLSLERITTAALTNALFDL